MIAIDTNILVYAHFPRLPKHQASRERLGELAESGARWSIPVFCVGEFFRIATHRRLFDPPFSTVEAIEAIKRVLASPTLIILYPGGEYLRLLYEAMLEASTTGNLVFDAQIVALCRESGVRALLTEDRDFHRFEDFPTEHLA